MKVTHGAGCLLLVIASGCGGSDASLAAPATPPSATVTPAAPAPPSPTTTGNPDEAAVEAARASLRACYDKARSANAALGRTTMTLSFRVESGHVSTVNIDYKNRFDDQAKQCMRDAALAIAFPPGDPRKVEVPVTFEPR